MKGEIPSMKLRAKMVALSRVSFNVGSIINNVLLPNMLTGGSWNLGAKTAFMFVSLSISRFTSLSEPVYLCLICCVIVTKYYRLGQTC